MWHNEGRSAGPSGAKTMRGVLGMRDEASEHAVVRVESDSADKALVVGNDVVHHNCDGYPASPQVADGNRV